MNIATLRADYRARERGMAALMSILFLLIVVAFAVVIALSMSGSNMNDTAMQHNSVNALFMAESGVERAVQRYGSGTACGAALQDGAPIAFGGGSFQVITPVPFVTGGLCQIRVRGIYGSSTRVIDAQLSGVTATGGSVSGPIALEAANAVGSASNVNSISVPLTIGGTGRYLVVGITVDTVAGSAISTVTYAGQALARQGQIGTNPLTEVWTLANPPAGTANVVASFGAGQSDQMAVGALSFTGVNLTTPLDVAVVPTSGNSNTASATITPATDNAWLVDVVSVNNGVAITMDALATRVSRWNLQLGGSVTGAGATLGPVSPAAARTLQWTWGGGNRRWAQIALALRPAPQMVVQTEAVQ